MTLSGPALRLMVLIKESDQWHHRSLYTEIVHRAHAAGLAGASVFHGIEGFGKSEHIHTARILSLSDELPCAVVIVDRENKIRDFLPVLDELVTEGLVTVEPVEVVRYVSRADAGEQHSVSLLLVLIGGAIGAPLRYLTDQAVNARHTSVFPFGTLVVNATGSLTLGVVAGLATVHDVPAWLLTLVGTGFCGALTTFSTFGYETVRLVEDGSFAEAALNVVVTLTVGLAAVLAGWAVAVGLG